MKEPRVATGKRTMLYMALSLAFTAGGIIVCYLLYGVRPVEGKTMNAVLIRLLRRRCDPLRGGRRGRLRRPDPDGRTWRSLTYGSRNPMAESH